MIYTHMHKIVLIDLKITFKKNNFKFEKGKTFIKIYKRPSQSNWIAAVAMEALPDKTDQMLLLMKNAVNIFDNLSQMNEILINKFVEFKNMTQILETSMKRSKVDNMPILNEQQPMEQINLIKESSNYNIIESELKLYLLKFLI